MGDDTETSDETEQCIALTGGGERCSREAEDGDFCYQHDESDETVDGSAAADGGSGTESESRDSENDEESDVDKVNELEDAAGGIEPDDEAEDDESEGSDDESVDILEVRKLVETTASDLIGRELDGISEIRAEEDGWLVVVDLIERPAVPDSQDILGSYEIELGTGGAIHGYRRINRYRRSDTADVE
ncbi:Gas vesicle synthesis protein GvpO [Halopelagius inordinatus]|uniref:Gas vesicle synthesis protein GvpO n=1 Tax=Halopelagius inordinatus TaxID=553467 RepID=A0A1I2T9B7_9EURY|nr:gas vesicle protein GvpO [Halopelagius inordinatus]SFG61603.1 Gas vesicle synthesis protein GvpO [Halopelagius inordinatus]